MKIELHNITKKNYINLMKSNPTHAYFLDENNNLVSIGCRFILRKSPIYKRILLFLIKIIKFMFIQNKVK